MSYFFLPFTFQIVLQSIVLFPFTLIFGKPDSFREGVLIIWWHEWFDNIWHFTTCVGFLYGCSPGAENNKATWFHEVGVHIKQYEDLAVLSDIVALGVYLGTGSWVTALVIWATGGPLWLLPNFFTSLRFRKAWKELGWKTWRGIYMFSGHERDAYAQTEVFIRNGGGR